MADKKILNLPMMTDAERLCELRVEILQPRAVLVDDDYDNNSRIDAALELLHLYDEVIAIHGKALGECLKRI